jgi:hypothetical protein
LVSIIIHIHVKIFYLIGILIKMIQIEKKRTKVELKIEQKWQIIDYHQKNPNIQQVALIQYFNKLFNVNLKPQTLSGILSASSRNKILKQDNVEAFNKRIREAKYPYLEKMLYIWHGCKVNSGAVINDEMLLEKAKEFGSQLGIVENSSFNYSDGWLKRFKERFNIKRFEIYGESGSVSEEETRQARADILKFVVEWLAKGGKIENIFNMDETAFFYKLLPSATLATGRIEGKKISKERITVAVIVNATGTTMTKPIVIGKHKKPHCFGRWDPNSIVSYYYNSSAWMTMNIFEDWIIKFDRSMNVRKKQVCLLLDNASGHNVSNETTKKLTNTVLKYFKPNTTSKIQPADQGIIRNLKCKYRPLVIKKCLLSLDENDQVVMPNLKEAICMIRESWNQVTAKTIANCWKHARKDIYC